MRKVFYKLRDINHDIKEYRKQQRKFERGSKKHKDITAELEWLLEQKEKLSKANKGNAAYWHHGIPPAPVKKAKPLTARAKKQKQKKYLEDQIQIYSDKQQAIREHIDDLQRQLALL